MGQVVIAHPVINAPFEEPRRHFRFSDEGITDEIVPGRRSSAYFIPIARPKKDVHQFALFDDWTKDRIEENRFINDVRARVAIWRRGGYQGITGISRRLLDYWTAPGRERKLFFCQIEALETAIYITEVARNHGDAWIDNWLRRENEAANPGLFRMAFKIATGGGKTLVAAMLIAWHALNKRANPQDGRFSDAFLIVAPGIAIRDRLRVLLPNDPHTYYRQHDLVPGDLLGSLEAATIVITNYHAFKLRERVAVGRLTKEILAHEGADTFTETPDQMVRRVCRELGGHKKNIIVINDEAHHCYRRKPDYSDDGNDVPKGDERREIEERNEEGRVWISGLEAVRNKIGVKAVYDLSATPFFIGGSGYPEGTLFPWVVSDFALIDAIESGITKVPRVPVSDDSMRGDLPTYRYFWPHIREHLPKRVKKAEMVGVEPRLPSELQGALHSLYSNYEKLHRLWGADAEAGSSGRTPPVFIIVCNNTTVSKLVYDYVSGWEKTLQDGTTVCVPGQLPLFSNVGDGHWENRPTTILIDSAQLESGEAMSPDFKRIAAREIEEFKEEYRARFPGRDADDLTDEDLLREVMNTVGKPGRLGEGVKCVVSVSMLTEGWDTNTVTHVLGVRAFGTQLLCEQVVGRALRRVSYAVNEQGLLDPEYAEVYGVPFSFIPSPGTSTTPLPPRRVTRVRALEERASREITYPRLVGYSYELPVKKLKVEFGESSRLVLSSADIPTKTENAPIVGESSIHTLDDLAGRRTQEVVFDLARSVLESHFHDCDNVPKSWFFPQLLDITRHWVAECVSYKDNTFPQLLLLSGPRDDAVSRIMKSIMNSTEAEGKPTVRPILNPYNMGGSTRSVDFDTLRPVYRTDPAKCHVSHVVADTESWEQKLTHALEDMSEIVCYVKNEGLGFTIPYAIDGREHNYVPDFIVRVRDGQGDPLNLIVEVTGQRDRKKAAKVDTADTLWVPAVNGHGGFGRWAFREIDDPWNVQQSFFALLS